MNITDFVTQIGNKEDVPFLRRPLFDVNMRLFHSSKGYRDIVLSCCQYVRWLALTKMDGYTQPFGMSGANAGIPFNIIGYVKARKSYYAECIIMLNPHVRNYADTTHKAWSNCGSIRLPKPIRVHRADWVDVDYFDEQGKAQSNRFSRRSSGDTVQHEIEHNKGILITDLEVHDADSSSSTGK